MIRGHSTASIDFVVLPFYFVLTIAIGWFARRRSKTANAYLNASHSLPLWVVVAAYLAANCGALEIVGLSAMAAEYGAAAFDFYWIGAIPAMVFLGLWMMPVYRRNHVRTVPEYLERRYGLGLRLVNACVAAAVMLLLAGVSLYAIAQVLQVILGFGFRMSIVVSSAVVLVYVLLGGIRATIYNEVFQLLIMLGDSSRLLYPRFGPWAVGSRRERICRMLICGPVCHSPLEPLRSMFSG